MRKIYVKKMDLFLHLLFFRNIKRTSVVVAVGNVGLASLSRGRFGYLVFFSKMGQFRLIQHPA